MIKRATLNFMIDLVSFVDLLFLAVTGTIMKWILPPGTGGHGRALTGGRGRQEIKYLWSMTRHDWGDIHFILALLFVFLVAVHLVLHWNWIKGYFKSLLGISGRTAS